jgi:hypothetical protein
MIQACNHIGKKLQCVTNVTRAPLSDEHWTAFLVFRCSCGELVGFPDSNYRDALENGTQETKAELAKLR